MNDLILEICAEKKIKVESLSNDYILKLTIGDDVKFIYGGRWDINTAASDRIASDKFACYILMDGLPRIEHELIFNPCRRFDYIQPNGTWLKALGYYEKHNRKLVAKPNQGSGGTKVFYCDSPPSLERAIHAIFAENPDAVLSPYHEINYEYRVFYLNGRALYAYGKKADKSWMHNLSQGAIAFEITDTSLLAEIKDLACLAAKRINIHFATVDIAHLKSGELAIMEINSGIFANQLLNQLPHLKCVIKDIYTEAILPNTSV